MRSSNRLGRALFAHGLSLALLFYGSGCARHPRQRVEIVVAAAASLGGVLPEIAARYERAHADEKVTLTFGASGELRQQVVAGAPIDVVVFAGAAPVEDLIARGLALPESRQTLASNTLVLVGPKGGKRLTFATLEELAPTDKLAVGDPRSVPAGQYAKAALERLHEWESLSGRLVYGSDVAAVLGYARRGEVAAAIVYKTELHGISDIELLDELSDGLSPRPEVVAAVAGGSHAKREALTFLAYLDGTETRSALLAYGFGPP